VVPVDQPGAAPRSRGTQRDLMQPGVTIFHLERWRVQTSEADLLCDFFCFMLVHVAHRSTFKRPLHNHRNALHADHAISGYIVTGRASSEK
jgi:hypothetical protein